MANTKGEKMYLDEEKTNELCVLINYVVSEYAEDGTDVISNLQLASSAIDSVLATFKEIKAIPPNYWRARDKIDRLGKLYNKIERK